jgi:hypothetical protein
MLASMYLRFAFEGDLHRTLEFIPIAVRRKLDLAGVKLSLAAWNGMSRAEKLAVCHLPVDGDGDLEVYREALAGFAERAGDPIAPLPSGPVDRREWRDLPEALAGRVDPERWSRLSDEARYVVAKLCDPRKSKEKLEAALRELGLAGRGAGPEREGA